MRYRLALAVFVALLASGCERASTIEGDLSLGATKGAFRTVVLVRNPADSVASVIDAQCLAERTDIAAVTASIKTFQATADRFRSIHGKTSLEQVALIDSGDKYRKAAADAQRALSDRPDTTHQKNLALLRAATDTQVEADREGHFLFPKRQKGSYLLFAEWSSATAENEFLSPVDFSAGGKKAQNLDQSTVSTRLRCR